MAGAVERHATILEMRLNDLVNAVNEIKPIQSSCAGIAGNDR